MGHIGPDNMGLGGLGVTEWNNSSSQSMGPTASVSVSSTDQSSIIQPYQQPPSSTYSSIPTSSVPSHQTSQQQFQQQPQTFQQQPQPTQAPQQQQQQYQPQTSQTPQQQQQQFPTQSLESQQMGLQQTMPINQQMTGALQGSQLQQLQAQQAQAQQLVQQQTWLQQADQQAQQHQQQQQQQNVYDQSGRLSSGVTQFSQSPSPLTQQAGMTQSQDQYNLQLLQQQNAQGMQHLGASGGVPPTSQAGPGAKSISGLLADFSRALGIYIYIYK
jgi:hypothetical protein